MKNIWLISKRVYILCFYEVEFYEMIRKETPETRMIKKKKHVDAASYFSRRI